MYVFEHSQAELAPWIRAEVEFPGAVARGARGLDARRVQEWLNLHGFGLVVDSDFGPVTARVVGLFQQQHGLEPTGLVEEPTFAALVRPMAEVLGQRLLQSTDTPQTLLEYAHAHLMAHPREVGGANRGPWVRLYMQGSDGAASAWCAGFVTFLLHQATESLQVPIPVDGSFSCDFLAAQAREAGLLLPGSQANPETLPEGSIFLVRRSAADWTHTGLVSDVYEAGFDTIEGNTNDDGHREGVEVCARSRGYGGKDFITLGAVTPAFDAPSRDSASRHTVPS